MSKAAHELTRKEMRAPDRFQVAAGQAAAWVSAHQKQLVAAVAVGVAIVALGVGFTSFARSREDKAGALLYRALDNMDGQISSVPLPGVQGPLFKSDEERQRAVIAAAEQVRKDYPSARAAATASLALGDAHLRLGENDQALEAYRAYLNATTKQDSLRFAALEGIAYALESKGDLSGAEQALDRLASEDTFHKDRATLERARVLAKAGRLDEAKKLLAAFGDEFKDSPLRPEAQERLARLGGK